MTPRSVTISPIATCRRPGSVARLGCVPRARRNGGREGYAATARVAQSIPDPTKIGHSYAYVGFYAQTLEFLTPRFGLAATDFGHWAGHLGRLSRKRCLVSVRGWPASRGFPCSGLGTFPEKGQLRPKMSRACAALRSTSCPFP
jgi:hypothetical protein